MTVGAVPLMRTCDIQRLLLRDGDRVIVNCLGELLSTDPDWYVDAALKVHADHIRQKLEGHRQNEKMLAKYRWAVFARLVTCRPGDRTCQAGT